MRRISTRLSDMVASVLDEAARRARAATLKGPQETVPIVYETPAASAQIKSPCCSRA
jgi:3-phosphoshikimate 1-carboxyvinyltransferase